MRTSPEWITQQIKILCSNMPIKDNIVCLLHYGSVKQKEDFRDGSDLDFHLVLKTVDEDALEQTRYIFGFSNQIDLSIHALDEIIHDEKVIFQNGNQGMYFMHVLSSSEVIVGKNIYKDLVKSIDEAAVVASIIEKIRYYIWLLRRNYVFDNDVRVYQKYFVRIIKDILILQKYINYENISDLNSRQTVNLFIDKHQEELAPNEAKLLASITNSEQVLTIGTEKLLVYFSTLVNRLTWSN